MAGSQPSTLGSTSAHVAIKGSRQVACPAAFTKLVSAWMDGYEEMCIHVPQIHMVVKTYMCRGSVWSSKVGARQNT